ncbi:hypothetical protein GBA52_013579 [Prunus armeniaca]|nr:hypothetical protein GBA52_013579 [Prunus armeniaca]
MGIIISSLGRVFLLLFLLVWVTEGLTQPKFFNVMDYGAVGGGRTDNSKAFLKAWSDACQWNGKSRVVVPQGTFKLYPVIFSGPCNGPIAFVIRGTLKATTDPSSFSAHSWINFRYVDELTVSGGGTLDGQGASAWHLNNCRSNPQCQALPITSSSSVQISDITYKNIWGRSSSEVAVSLVCSKSRPCKNVVLENINLAHSNPPGRSSSVCLHAKGASHGSQTPPPCL